MRNLKIEQARELAALFAEQEETDVAPEDVAEMSDYDLMDWMHAWGFEWDGLGWGREDMYSVLDRKVID